MSGYCANNAHADCPDAHDDSGLCCCTCHLVFDYMDIAVRGVA